MAKQAHRKLGIDWSNPEAVQAYYAEYQRGRRTNDPAWAEKTRQYQRDRDRALAAEDPDFWKKQNGHIAAWKHKLKLEYPERYKDMVRKGQGSKEVKRNSSLKRQYGLSIEKYDAMFQKQGGVCAICRQPETSASNSGAREQKRLAVDHSHKTGKVRQLLCSLCNTALGKFKENVSVLEAAINYLKRHE